MLEWLNHFCFFISRTVSSSLSRPWGGSDFSQDPFGSPATSLRGATRKGSSSQSKPKSVTPTASMFSEFLSPGSSSGNNFVKFLDYSQGPKTDYSNCESFQIPNIFESLISNGENKMAFYMAISVQNPFFWFRFWMVPVILTIFNSMATSITL